MMSLTIFAALSTASPRLNSLADLDRATLARGVSCGVNVHVCLSSFIAAITAACKEDTREVCHTQPTKARTVVGRVCP